MKNTLVRHGRTSTNRTTAEPIGGFERFCAASRDYFGAKIIATRAEAVRRSLKCKRPEEHLDPVSRTREERLGWLRSP